MNKKKIILVLSVIGLLFVMTGCTMPMDESGHVIQITDSTTFQYMMENEGIFSAIFIYPLAKVINYLVPRTNIAIAIAIVTITINAVLLLLTWKQSVAQQKIQLIQPEMAKISKKYEGRTDQNSQMRQAQEMQALYKKYDVNPFGSILVSFIQFPVLIAMYHAVQRASAVATGNFLGLSLETTPMAGITSGQFGYAIIFILMVGAQLLSMKIPTWLAQKRAKEEAEKHFRRYEKPENTSAMMMYGMLLFISFLMVNWPTAMTFYYLIYSLVMILKNVIIDKLIAKQGQGI